MRRSTTMLDGWAALIAAYFTRNAPASQTHVCLSCSRNLPGDILVGAAGIGWLKSQFSARLVSSCSISLGCSGRNEGLSSNPSILSCAVSTACATLYSAEEEIKSNVGRTDSNRINANESLRPTSTPQRKQCSGRRCAR